MCRLLILMKRCVCVCVFVYFYIITILLQFIEAIEHLQLAYPNYTQIAMLPCDNDTSKVCYCCCSIDGIMYSCLRFAVGCRTFVMATWSVDDRADITWTIVM
jgi:hypothetical protein